MKGQDAESLAGVLGQCPALAHLQCRELVHLNLSGNWIHDAGTESLAGVLGQCAALAHLNLSGIIKWTQVGQKVLQECWGSAQRWFTSISANDIGTVGEERLRASWCGQASGLVL